MVIIISLTSKLSQKEPPSVISFLIIDYKLQSYKLLSSLGSIKSMGRILTFCYRIWRTELIAVKSTSVTKILKCGLFILVVAQCNSISRKCCIGKYHYSPKFIEIKCQKHLFRFQDSLKFYYGYFRLVSFQRNFDQFLNPFKRYH